MARSGLYLVSEIINYFERAVLVLGTCTAHGVPEKPPKPRRVTCFLRENDYTPIFRHIPYSCRWYISYLHIGDNSGNLRHRELMVRSPIDMGVVTMGLRCF